MSEMQMVEGYLLKQRGNDEIFPTTTQEDMESATGGMVASPPNDMVSWVSVLDLKSLYPSSILTGNISEETLTWDEDEADIIIPSIPLNDEHASGSKITEDDIGWDLDNGATGIDMSQEGILSKYLGQLFPERDYYKSKRNEYSPDEPQYDTLDNRQRGVKVLMNCFSRDTDVMTPQGIKNIRDIELGDLVYSINPKTHDCEFKRVVNTVNQPNYYGELHQISGPSHNFKITENHQMFVERNRSYQNPNSLSRYSFKEYADLKPTVRYEFPEHKPIEGVEPKEFELSSFDEYRVFLYHKGHGRPFCRKLPDEVSELVSHDKSTATKDGRTRYILEDQEVFRRYKDEIVSLCEDVEIQFAPKHSSIPFKYDIENWLRLMGWFISEGHCFEDPRTNAKGIQLSQKTEPGISKIKNLLDNMGFSYSKDQNGFTISNRIIYEWMKENCGSYSKEKTIPDFVFSYDYKLLNILRESLMFGDGDTNSERYTTSSEFLKEDYARLLVHIGENPRISRDSKTNRITPSDAKSFTKHLNSEVEEHNGNVHCITVEDNHTVLAGRNGKFQWIGQSFFGNTDNKYFRLSKQGFGDAITALSRYVSWKGMEVAREMEYDVIYSDTDSIFLQLAGEGEDVTVDEVVERSMELEEEINSKMDEIADDIGIGEEHPYLSQKDLHGTDRQCFLWESEKVYKKYLQAGSKKRYAGHIVWKEGKDVDETDISGFEAVRSSSPVITSEFQEGLIERILRSDSFEEISEYTQNFAEEVESGQREIKEYGVPGVLNKPPEEYPNRPLPRACEYSNEYLGNDFREGDNPFMVYISDTPANKPSTGEIAVKWNDESVPSGFTVDYQKHIKDHMKQPLESILELTSYDFGELRTGKRSQSAFESSGDGSNPFSSDSNGVPSNPFSD